MQLPLFTENIAVPAAVQKVRFRYTKLPMIKDSKTGAFERWGEEYWAEPEWQMEREQAISHMHFLKDNCRDFCGQFEIALVPEGYPRSCQPWHKHRPNYLAPQSIEYPLKNMQ